jgi:hypothetical protein
MKYMQKNFISRYVWIWKFVNQRTTCNINDVLEWFYLWIRLGQWKVDIMWKKSPQARGGKRKLLHAIDVAK